jgi:hypothetical protein
VVSSSLVELRVLTDWSRRARRWVESEESLEKIVSRDGGESSETDDDEDTCDEELDELFRELEEHSECLGVLFMLDNRSATSSM